MPRLVRTVFPKIPHHITQRGNRREDVFFSAKDFQMYLQWLGKYCEKHQVEILAYCLMTNHVHLILKPEKEDGLQKVLKPLHMRYAQYVNKIKGWKGHLWQGRYYSSALDESYTWSAIRYVERNPVRANMVEKSENYRWSSAAAHCGLKPDKLLAKIPEMEKAIAKEQWSEWLRLPDQENEIKILRRNVEQSLPCGSNDFIGLLEKISGRPLSYRAQGRPVKG